MTDASAESSQAPYLTVLIPVRNEERYIGQTLQMLAMQDYPRDRFEILVVDGRSSDSTRQRTHEFAKEHPGIRLSVLDNPRQLSSSGRNIGIREAKGELIAVVDAHVYVPTDQLFATMEALKRGRRRSVWPGPPLLVPGLEGSARWIAIARKTWLAHSRNSYIYSHVEGFVDPRSSGFAYDRSVFDRIGFFDENFDAAEDVELHWRLSLAGIRAYTSPRLTIYSYPRSNLRNLYRQMTRYGVGRRRLLRKHPRAFTMETLVPPGLFLLFAMAPLAFSLSLWAPVLSIVFSAVVFPYGLVLGVTAVVASFRQGHLSGALMIAAAIWVTHMGLGWGFLKASLRH